MDQERKDSKPRLQPRTRDRSQRKVVGKQRGWTPHDPLKGEHPTDGLFKFHRERRDLVSPGETPEQGSAEPNLRDDEGGPCYRRSYERGANLVQHQTGVHI